jgi:hypothetical protein
MEAIRTIEPTCVSLSVISSISIPIPIPKSQSYTNINTIEEYSLNCSNFNPSKMSPPNHWKCRLEHRYKSYYMTDSNVNNK